MKNPNRESPLNSSIEDNGKATKSYLIAIITSHMTHVQREKGQLVLCELKGT